ncbi:protein-tyrosine phosphatase family protein [Brevibacterium casei]|uniref:protein-tyrosine phosphatase family protein n=1 Tax=Brevibacterium TaxID=1696 RepID=UPI0002F4927A|nr:protein-tyrosine phosphatase family protein [Brevibacterium casei]NJE66708.1 protein phosphatase [Brevibacterium sp. LS14]QQT69444.1 protein phosphatase [Brevibacterium casei]
MTTWEATQPGVLELPSGRLVRGRSLARSGGVGGSGGSWPADFELILLGTRREFEARASGVVGGTVAGGRALTEYRWVRWPDFRLPHDRGEAAAAFTESWRRSLSERVGVACLGGRGRTGTALACIAILDGVPPAEAVAFVREHYDPRAVETPWQRRYVERFGPESSG